MQVEATSMPKEAKMRIYNREGGILPPLKEAGLRVVELSYEDEGSEDLQQGQQRHLADNILTRARLVDPRDRPSSRCRQQKSSLQRHLADNIRTRGKIHGLGKKPSYKKCIKWLTFPLMLVSPLQLHSRLHCCV